MASVGWLDVLIGVFVGGAITGFFSWYFYQRSSKDLKDEAAALREESEKLRQQTTLIMRGLEEMGKSGKFEYTQDEGGEFTGGIAVERTVSGTSGPMGGAAHVRRQDDEDDRTHHE